MLNENRIFKDRVKNIGIVSHKVLKIMHLQVLWLEEVAFLMI
jgi:NADH:ubiquinone oxidoreductase subunit D